MTNVQYDTDKIIKHNGMCPINNCSGCSYNPLCTSIDMEHLTDKVVLSGALRVKEINYDITTIIFEECL